MSNPSTYLDRRRAAGQCTVCGDEPLEPDNKTYGPICGEIQRKASRERQRRLRERGRCTACGQRRAFRCGKCRDCLPAFRQQHSASAKKRVKEGFCEKCTNRQSSRSIRYCDWHLDGSGPMSEGTARRRAAKGLPMPRAGSDR